MNPSDYFLTSREDHEAYLCDHPPVGDPEPEHSPEQTEATGPCMLVTIHFPTLISSPYIALTMEILERKGLLDAADEYAMHDPLLLHYPDDTLFRDIDEWCRDAWGCGLIRDWKIER